MVKNEYPKTETANFAILDGFFLLSGGEVLAAALPTAYVYKAWNTVGAEQMVHPDGSLISGEQLVMMYAGAAEKKDIAAKLVEDSGFIPAYVGPIRFARNLEVSSTCCMLRVSVGGNRQLIV